MRRILTTVALVGSFALVAGACGSAESDSSAPADTSGVEAPADTTGTDTEGTDTPPSDDAEVATTESAGSDEGSSAEPPTIVVTTNILGDLVADVVGDLATVEVIMPLGSNPHDFAPSARQAETMENADLLVVNGAGFEEGMLDVIDNVAGFGTPVFAAADALTLLEGGHHDHGHDDHGHDDEKHSDDEQSDDEHSDDHGHDDHGHDEEHSDEGHDDHGHDDEKHTDEEHSDEEHSDEEHSDEEHDHGAGGDPHIWTDPARMAEVVEAMRSPLAALDGIDADALDARVDDAVARLLALDAEIEELLAVIEPADRVLVTNHQVFAYFADRYGFEIVGAVIPSLTTNAAPSAADIEELAEILRAEGVPAIFGETTQSTQLAEVLAEEVGGDVRVVELFSESLGDDGTGAETYAGMMRTNAMLIVEALTGA